MHDVSVLIVASGSSFHNFSHWHNAGEVSLPFDQWLNTAVCDPNIATREAKLLEWAQAPSARVSHPREEHLIPLMVAAGAAGTDLGTRIYSEKMPLYGIHSSAFRFG